MSPEALTTGCGRSISWWTARLDGSARRTRRCIARPASSSSSRVARSIGWPVIPSWREANYATALGREATRIVSCNTTSIVRTLRALKRAGLLQWARDTLLWHVTDPWGSHLGGIMNTLLPEARIPSHQAPDAQSVDPELDLVTMAVKVPETVGRLHYWWVQSTRPVKKRMSLPPLQHPPGLR